MREMARTLLYDIEVEKLLKRIFLDIFQTGSVSESESLFSSGERNTSPAEEKRLRRNLIKKGSEICPKNERNFAGKFLLL